MPDQNESTRHESVRTEVANRRTMDFIESLEQRKLLADKMVDSEMLPDAVDSANKAMTIMLMGHELDVPPMQAMSSINVIEGKPTLSGHLMMALCIRDADVSFDIRKRNENGAAVRIERPGWEPQTFTFTRKDAQRAGLLNKSMWRQYPKAMFFWRAVSEACRMVCPDVITGMYTPEELADEAEIDPETGGLADAEEVAAEAVPEVGEAVEVAEATDEQLETIDQTLSELEALNPERAADASDWVDGQGDLTQTTAARVIEALKHGVSEEREDFKTRRRQFFVLWHDYTPEGLDAGDDDARHHWMDEHLGIDSANDLTPELFEQAERELKGKFLAEIDRGRAEDGAKIDEAMAAADDELDEDDDPIPF